MKTNLFATTTMVALFIMLTQCSENEVVTPDERQTSVQSKSRDAEGARKKTDGKYIATPVTGTIDGLAFTAEYRITEFIVENDVLYASGYLTNITGSGLPVAVAQLSGEIIKMPVDTGDQPRQGASSRDRSSQGASSGRTAACDILFLDLGPLDLNLLGLAIHLDEVVLEIVAETGAGNLLGNLLCAVTGLLDGVAALQAIANLLNQIIDIIGVLP